MAGNTVGGGSGLSALSEGVSESSSTTSMSSPPSAEGNPGPTRKLLSSPGEKLAGDGKKGVGSSGCGGAQILEKGPITVANVMGNGPTAVVGNGPRPDSLCTSKAEGGNITAPACGSLTNDGRVVDRCGGRGMEAEEERRQRDRQSNTGRRGGGEGGDRRQSGGIVEEECERNMRDGEYSNGDSISATSVALEAAAASAVARSPFATGYHSASPGAATTVQREGISVVEGGQHLAERGGGERNGSDLDSVGGADKGRHRLGLEAMEGWECGHRGMNGEDDCPFRRPDFVVKMCLTLYKVRSWNWSE